MLVQAITELLPKHKATTNCLEDWNPCRTRRVMMCRTIMEMHHKAAHIALGAFVRPSKSNASQSPSPDIRRPTRAIINWQSLSNSLSLQLHAPASYDLCCAKQTAAQNEREAEDEFEVHKIIDAILAATVTSINDIPAPSSPRSRTFSARRCRARRPSHRSRSWQSACRCKWPWCGF